MRLNPVLGLCAAMLCGWHLPVLSQGAAVLQAPAPWSPIGPMIPLGVWKPAAMLPGAQIWSPAGAVSPPSPWRSVRDVKVLNLGGADPG
jgi:hypothetical protein